MSAKRALSLRDGVWDQSRGAPGPPKPCGITVNGGSQMERFSKKKFRGEVCRNFRKKNTPTVQVLFPLSNLFKQVRSPRPAKREGAVRGICKVFPGGGKSVFRKRT